MARPLAQDDGKVSRSGCLTMGGPYVHASLDDGQMGMTPPKGYVGAMRRVAV
jgi:hypothetical protein